MLRIKRISVVTTNLPLILFLFSFSFPVPKFDTQLPSCQLVDLPIVDTSFTTHNDLDRYELSVKNPWALTMLREKGMASDHPYGAKVNHRDLRYSVFSNEHPIYPIPTDEKEPKMHQPVMKSLILPDENNNFSTRDECAIALFSVGEAECVYDQKTLNALFAPHLFGRDLKYVYSDASRLRFVTIKDLKRACELIGYKLTAEAGEQMGDDDLATPRMLYRFFHTLCNSGTAVSDNHTLAQWLSEMKLDRVYDIDMAVALQVNLNRLGQLMRCLQRIREMCGEGQHREVSIGLGSIGYYDVENVIKTGNHFSTVDHYARVIGAGKPRNGFPVNQAFSCQIFKLCFPANYGTMSMDDTFEVYSRYGRKVASNQGSSVQRNPVDFLVSVVENYVANAKCNRDYMFHLKHSEFVKGLKEQHDEQADLFLDHAEDNDYQNVLASEWNRAKIKNHVQKFFKGESIRTKFPGLEHYDPGLSNDFHRVLGIYKYCALSQSGMNEVKSYFDTVPAVTQQQTGIFSDRLVSRRLPYVGAFMTGPVAQGMKMFKYLFCMEKQIFYLLMTKEHKDSPEVQQILKSEDKDFSEWGPWKSLLERANKNKDPKKGYTDALFRSLQGYSASYWSNLNKRITEAAAEQYMVNVFRTYNIHGTNPMPPYADFFKGEKYVQEVVQGGKYANDAIRFLAW